MPSVADTTRFGKYVILSKLGEGGMGRVDRAVLAGPMGFHKEVAIKRIKTDSPGSRRAGSALINEARLGGQLKHPNIVEVYELAEMDDGMFISMEFVNGITLDRVLGACYVREIKLPLPVVFDLLAQLCAALQYAHSARDTAGRELEVVHRDLKPANVIVARDGTVKIMDFGIAKTTANLFVTQTTGVAKGTPLYMSPEQIEGAKDLDRRSDLFAVGALLYELATGDRLFEAEGVANMFWRVIKCDVADQLLGLEALHPGLGAAARGCLRADKNDRYSDAGELAAALRAIRPPEWDAEPGLREFVHAMIGTSAEHDPTLGTGPSTDDLLTSFAGLPPTSRWPAVAAGLRRDVAPEDDPLVDGLQPVYNSSDLDTLVNRAMTGPLPGDTPPMVVPPEVHGGNTARAVGLTMLVLVLIAIAIVALLPGSTAPPEPGPVAEAVLPEAVDPIPEPAPVEPTPPPTPEAVPAPTPEAAPEATPEPAVADPVARPEPTSATPAPTPEPTPEPTPAVMVSVRLNTIPWATLSTGHEIPVLDVEMAVGTVIVATVPQSGKTHTFVVRESWAGRTMCWDFRKDAACAR